MSTFLRQRLLARRRAKKEARTVLERLDELEHGARGRALRETVATGAAVAAAVAAVLTYGDGRWWNTRSFYDDAVAVCSEHYEKMLEINADYKNMLADNPGAPDDRLAKRAELASSTLRRLEGLKSYVPPFSKQDFDTFLNNKKSIRDLRNKWRQSGQESAVDRPRLRKLQRASSNAAQRAGLPVCGQRDFRLE